MVLQTSTVHDTTAAAARNLFMAHVHRSGDKQFVAICKKQRPTGEHPPEVTHNTRDRAHTCWPIWCRSYLLTQKAFRYLAFNYVINTVIVSETSIPVEYAPSSFWIGTLKGMHIYYKPTVVMGSTLHKSHGQSQINFPCVSAIIHKI